MDQSFRHNSSALAAHDAQFSTRGLMQRYARARETMLVARLSTMGLVSFALAVLYGPLLAVLAFVGHVCIALIEAGYLKRLSRDLDTTAAIARFRLVSTVLAGLYAFSICVIASVPLLATGDDAPPQLVMAEPFFALCVVLGPMLNASFDYRLLPGSSIIRNVIYGSLPTGLVLDAYFRISLDAGGAELLLAGIVALCLTQAWFLVFAQRRHVISHRAMRSFALQRQALEDAYQRLFEQKQQARQLAMIAEHANDGVILISPKGSITWVNDAFVDMMGYSKNDLIGDEPNERLNSNNTPQDVIDTIAAKRSALLPFRAEILTRRKDGAEIWVETNQVPLFDDAGNLECYIAVERDITATKIHQRELDEARRAAEEGARVKEEFLATMSHEIRTPMNGVLGMVQLLQRSDLDAEQRQYADTIASSSNALLTLINDLLEMSRMDAEGLTLHERDFDLHYLVRELMCLMRPQANEKGLDLRCVIDPTVPLWAKGDDRRIRQILINLLGNAIKFTDHGHVELRLDARPEGDMTVITFNVEDTGIGIPEDVQGRIFDRFSQADAAISRRFGGTGLGLSISRGLAQALGGDISVASDPGMGACFTVTLPLHQGQPVQAAKEEVEAPASEGDVLRGLRLLVAEDNRVNRLLIRKFLKNSGVELALATNGEEAIERFEDFKPDVILMDVSMPVVNGLEATRRIRALGGTQPYIAALTANADQASERACEEAGMEAFLTKPLSRADLFRVLSEYRQKLLSLAEG